MQSKAGPEGPAFAPGSGYLAFGVAAAAGFTGEATGLIGVPPGLPGVPVGEATGLGSGLAITTGVGDAGGFGGSGFAGSHALNTAVETARTVVNINDLLIVFS